MVGQSPKVEKERRNKNRISNWRVHNPVKPIREDEQINQIMLMWLNLYDYAKDFTWIEPYIKF